MNLSYRLRKQFADKLAVAKAGTKFVTEKDIADGKVLTYNAKKKILEYTTPSTGSGSGDMIKAVYDTNDDGVVDSAALATKATTIGASGYAIGALVDTEFLYMDGTTIKSQAGGGGGYTDEQAQDAIGAMIIDTATIDLTYTDATPELKADVKAASITEAMQVLADNTTNDVSITKHGYVPKAPNDTAKFLRGDATWATLIMTLATLVTANAGPSVINITDAIQTSITIT